MLPQNALSALVLSVLAVVAAPKSLHPPPVNVLFNLIKPELDALAL